MAEEKKIIIDEDWKEQAKKEREVLKAQEEAGKKKEQQEQKRRGPIPQADFAGLVSMLATQAMFALGVLGEAEQNEQKEPDLDLAKFNIDMLEVLGARTKNNLSNQEQEVLTATLHQVRMLYVRVAGKSNE